MWVLIGYGVVIAAVLGGYALSGGHLAALFQPLELLTIGGAAAGAFVVSNGLETSKHTLKVIPTLLKPSAFGRALNLELLSLLYDLGQKARRDGMLSLEREADHPDKSEIFGRYPAVSAQRYIVEFVTDYLRLMSTGTLDAHELEQLMDEEIETHREAGEVPIHAVTQVADALPGFGIVAAVMGVVHTMESIGEPPDVLGMLIARALVGTFLGILLAYGFVAPLAALMTHRLNESTKALQCAKTSLLGMVSGYSPGVAIEFGRKTLFFDERPTAQELEQHIKQK